MRQSAKYLSRLDLRPKRDLGESMQISLRFFKRLLLSVVFITSNSVYAVEVTTNGTDATSSSGGTGYGMTYTPPRAVVVPEAAGGVITNAGQMSSVAKNNLTNSGQVITSDKSGVNCASSPNPAAKDDDANKADCKSSDAIAQAVGQVVSLGTNNSKAINQAHTTFTEKWKSCTKVQGTAAYACLENLSPAISGATGPIGLLAAAGSGVSSATGSCDTVSKIMDIANMALTLYNTACSAAKASCALSCNGAVTALESIDKLNKSDKCPPTNPACSAHPAAQNVLSQALRKELDTGNTLSMAGKKKLCTGKYVELGISALGGIAAVVMAMGQADNCEKETEAATLDCTKPEQASTPTCLCQANPRLQGCANGLQKVGDAAGAGGIGSTKASTSNADDSGPVIPGGGGLDIERDPAAASSAGATGGGSGSGIGASGLSGNSANAAGGGKGRTGFDTNILGGSGGGGGGGWGKGFSAGSANSKLGAYLPGGAKDPNMNGNGGANEVTGQGGKSNWEKVRDRYRDNKTSLLNN